MGDLWEAGEMAVSATAFGSGMLRFGQEMIDCQAIRFRLPVDA